MVHNTEKMVIELQDNSQKKVKLKKKDIIQKRNFCA